MATNNSINKTSDTFVATTSVTTPAVTTSSGDLLLSAASTFVAIKNSHSIKMFYGSDPSFNHILYSLADGLQIDDGYSGGTSYLDAAQLRSNSLTSLTDLTLASVSPSTDVNINSARDINLAPTTSITNVAGKIRATNTLGQNFFEGKLAADSVPRTSFYAATGVTGLSLGTGGGTTSYLTFLGGSGMLTISPNSNGTGAGTLDTNAGTVKAATFSNASASLALSSGATTATLTAYSLTVNNAGAGDLILGTSSASSTTTPVTINMGGTSSSAAGQNLKLYIYNDGTAAKYGFGVSTGQLDYYAPLSGHHAWWQSTTKSMWLDASRILNLSDGLKLPTTGGTQTTLDYNERYTATVSVSGIWAAPQNVTIAITRVGTSVNMYLGGASQNTATVATTITAAAGSIPTRFLGSNSGAWGGFLRQPILVRDNGVDKLGVINITANGAFSISAGPGVGTAFAGAGASAYPDQSFPWSL